VGRQHIGKDRDEADTDEDQAWDQGKIAEPQGDPTPAQARRKKDGFGLGAH
jgi:hypothetical protein